MFSWRLKSIMILNCPVSCVSFMLRFAPNQMIILYSGPGHKDTIGWQVSLTIVSYILNLFISKIFMSYSKTNTTWFIFRSSKNSWSLNVGCGRLLPNASLNTMLYLYTTKHFGRLCWKVRQLHLTTVYMKAAYEKVRSYEVIWNYHIKMVVMVK